MHGEPARPPLVDRTVAGPAVAGRDLNCRDAAELVGTVDDYDFDRDGVPDQFVTMRCVSPLHPRTGPGQLEVFRGGSDRDNPVRLGVITHTWENQILTGCVGFAAGQAFTVGTHDGTRRLLAAHWGTVGREKAAHLVLTAPNEEARIAGCR